MWGETENRLMFDTCETRFVQFNCVWKAPLQSSPFFAFSDPQGSSNPMVTSLLGNLSLYPSVESLACIAFSDDGRWWILCDRRQISLLVLF